MTGNCDTCVFHPPNVGRTIHNGWDLCLHPNSVHREFWDAIKPEDKRCPHWKRIPNNKPKRKKRKEPA